MKKSKFIFLAFLSISLVSLPSCSDDPEEEVSPYIGDYVITEAFLTESVTLKTNELGAIPLAENTDITLMIQNALLGAVECVPESSLIELRENFSLYLSCAISGNELDGGTWEEQSSKVIILNMNNTAIPSSPTGLVLTISDLTLVDNVLSGETTVPLSREVLAGLVAAMSGGLATLDMENTPLALPLTFMIKLGKQ